MDGAGRFIDSEIWKGLVDRTEDINDFARQEAASMLPGRDFHDLLELLESSSAMEQAKALFIFQSLIRSHSNRLKPFRVLLREKVTHLAKGWTMEDTPTPSDKVAMLKWILERFSAKQWPNIPLFAYRVLVEIDKEAAAQFLISHFDYGAVPVTRKADVIRNLADLCGGDPRQRSETAMKRLIVIAESGEPEARTACGYLIGRCLMRRSEVAKLAGKWRDAALSEELGGLAVLGYD